MLGIFIFSVLGLLLFLSVEYEKGFFSAGVIAVGLVLAYFVYGFNAFTWSLQNAELVVIGILSYFAIGTVWARIKWEFFIRAALRHLLSNPMRGTAGIFMYGGQSQQIPVLISDNKARFMFWMGYWPVSMLWTIINDPVRRAFVWIYQKLAGSLQNSSNNVFKGYIDR